MRTSLREELLLVKKHNYFNSTHLSRKDENKMDILDYKIMNLAVARINNNLKLEEITEKDREIIITKEELIKYLKVKDINFYRFKKRISELMKKQIEHTEDTKSKKPKFKMITVFIDSEYDSEKLTLNFHPKLMNFLVELKENFTQYYYRYLTDFNSIYSIMIYELLKMNEYKFKKVDCIQFNIDELFDYFGLDTKRSRTYSFLKDRVINTAMNEINQYSDIRFKYKAIKKGRSYKEIQFYLYDKSEDEKEEKKTLSKEEIIKNISCLSKEELISAIEANYDNSLISDILKRSKELEDLNRVLKHHNENLMIENGELSEKIVEVK